MRRLAVVLMFTVFPPVAQTQERAQEQEQEQEQEKERVRATEPTVVTVHGKQPAAKGGFGTRVGGSIKTAAVKTWNGVVDAGGWLLNARDDVPSQRERNQQPKSSRLTGQANSYQ